MGNSQPRDIPIQMADEEDEDLLDLSVGCKVKNVHIDGLKKSKNELVTTSLEELFKAETFEDVITKAHLCKLKLERLRVFSNIDVFIDVADDSSDQNEFDVYYLVKESRSLTASVGTTVGNNEGNMLVTGAINNLRGTGESLKANISYGTSQTTSYEFSFGKPVGYNPDKKFSFRVLKSISDFSQSFYRETAKGLGMDVTLPSSIGLHTIGWDFNWRENSVLANAPFEVREFSGHSLKSALKHSFVSDGRDDWVLPSRGHLFKHSIELSDFIGNVRAWKSNIEIQMNKEIFDRVVLATSVQAGLSQSLDVEKPLLINDRSFIGGPTSIRGYKFKGIGYQAEIDGINSAALGGDMYWMSGLHLYTPLPFLRSEKNSFGSLFRMHYFINAGNLANLNNADPKDFFMNPRWSYGLGLMFMLGGMARLEVNYCIPKNAKPGDQISDGFQIGVGLNFL